MLAGGALVEPAGMAEVPGLQVGVPEAPLGHLLGRPFRGALVIRRSGEARAVAVGEHVQGVQNLRVLGLLFADAGVHVVGALCQEHERHMEAATKNFFMSTRIA